MRVLIADTDEMFLNIMQTYLQRFGHRVAIALDGLECKAILRDFSPDVLAPVRLRFGSKNYRLSLMGLEREPYLYRVLDDHQRPIHFDSHLGVTITSKHGDNQ